MKVLVTGGAGYIGSTTCTALRQAGHTPVILDSLVTGREVFTRGFPFYQGDIADPAILHAIFTDHPEIEACLHFAARIIVPESVEKPYLYYKENVGKSLELFRLLVEYGCRRVVFSSSASIYGNAKEYLVTEDAPLGPSSPYARTKYMMEMVLEDMCRATGLRGLALRYFNPIGADPGMRTGPYDASPSHIVGKLILAASGKEDVFRITGIDYPTRDGSGIRDYLHVWDLARAHVSALERFDWAMEKMNARYLPVNLGTGNGVTVRELLAAFEKVWGSPLRKVEAPPRPGDVAGAYANCDRARDLLGWKAELPIEQGISDALKWILHERVKVLGY